MEFAGFPSHRLTLGTRLRIRLGASASDLQRIAGVDLDRAFAGWRGNLAEAALVLERLTDGGALSVQELLVDFPDDRHPAVQMSLVWLAKLGILDWIEDDSKIIRFY